MQLGPRGEIGSTPRLYGEAIVIVREEIFFFRGKVGILCGYKMDLIVIKEIII